MRRHSSLIPLSHFHKRVLFTAQLAKGNSPPYPGYPRDPEGKKNYIIRFFESGLKDHFNAEEVELLPKVEEKSSEIKSLATDIRNEHRQIESIIRKLEDSQNLEEDLNELGYLLEKHVRKKERQFFQLVQDLLSEDELKTIAFKKI